MFKEDTKNNDFYDFIKIVIITLLIVIPFRTFIAKPFKVKGTSMIETFQNNDYLIVDEISYKINEPKRGDVVIFRNEKTSNKNFIKRIIGLPGETVIINNNQVTIINKDNPNGFIIEEPYITGITTGSKKFTIADDYYFMLGDNRENSLDSRYIGPVKKQDILGKAYLRLWPFSDINYLPGNHSFTQ